MSSNVSMVNPDVNSLKLLDSNEGLWDKSRVFKINPFFITPDDWEDLSSWHVCLSTQSSADLIFWIVDQTATWSGPMSVSVFVPDVDYIIAMTMIHYLRKCFPRIRQRVSFHFVYPNVLPPSYHDVSSLELDCSRPEEVNKELVRIIRTETLIKIMKISKYPQNLMRNVARQGCQNDFCFTPDIDMINIPSFSDELNAFLARDEVASCKKCAFVIPTYEISIKEARPPLAKWELLEYIKRKTARRFHIRIFRNNQANSNLTKRESIPIQQGLNIAYNITTWKKFWEPIYITKSNVPPYDERFIGYGFTRNSQVRKFLINKL